MIGPAREPRHIKSSGGSQHPGGSGRPRRVSSEQVPERGPQAHTGQLRVLQRGAQLDERPPLAEAGGIA
jgi:hypothetical protein